MSVDEESQIMLPSDLWSAKGKNKMLERCEVYPSWPTEKAHWYREKTTSLKKPTVKERAQDRSAKKCKISPVDIFMQKAHS